MNGDDLLIGAAGLLFYAIIGMMTYFAALIAKTWGP